MKLKHYILAFLFFVLQSLSAQTPYYYNNNDKIFISTDKEYIVVNSLVNSDFLQSYSTNYISKTDFLESEIRSFTNPQDSIAHSRVTLKNYYSEIRVTNAIKNNAPDYNNFVNALNQNANTIKVSPSFTYQGSRLGLTNYIFVKLKSLDDESVLYNYVQENSLEVIGNIPSMPEWYMVECTKSNTKNALELANQFHESGLFATAAPEFIHHGGSFGNSQTSSEPINNAVNTVDTFYADQWGLKNTGQYGAAYAGIDIKAEPAWAITEGDYDDNIIKVAVYDDGFEMNHPDLAQNVFGTGHDVINPGINPPSQVRGIHGTACAGIIAAVENNQGIIGVAPKAKIVSISKSSQVTGTTTGKL